MIFYYITFCLILFAADAARTDCDDKGCSHDCELVGEFPLCVCPPDMFLDEDGTTCKDTTSFLLAQFRGIRLYNEASDEETTVVPVRARCMDFHHGRKELYAYTNYTIMRYPISKGKSASPVSMVARTETAVTSLAVDWVHDVIYYIAEQQSELGMMSLDGGKQRAVVTHNDSSAAGWRSLVVDPHAKKLFWIGNNGVHSCSLEGEDLHTNVVAQTLPERIALDTSEQIIYTIGHRAGNSNKFITRSSYNGTKAGGDVQVSQPATVEIYGFGVLQNIAYWESNHNGENLYKCDLRSGGGGKTVKPTLVTELNQVVYDMKVYHKDIQKSSQSDA